MHPDHAKVTSPGKLPGTSAKCSALEGRESISGTSDQVKTWLHTPQKRGIKHPGVHAVPNVCKALCSSFGTKTKTSKTFQDLVALEQSPACCRCRDRAAHPLHLDTLLSELPGSWAHSTLQFPPRLCSRGTSYTHHGWAPEVLPK